MYLNIFELCSCARCTFSLFGKTAVSSWRRRQSPFEHSPITSWVANPYDVVKCYPEFFFFLRWSLQKIFDELVMSSRQSVYSHAVILIVFLYSCFLLLIYIHVGYSYIGFRYFRKFEVVFQLCHGQENFLGN